MGRVPQLTMHGPASVAPGERIRYELELIGETYDVQYVELFARSSRGVNLPGTMAGAARQLTGVLGSAIFHPRGPGNRFPLELAIPPRFPPSHIVGESLAWSRVWIDTRVMVQKRVYEQYFPIHIRGPIEDRGPEPVVARATESIELAIGLGTATAAPGTTLVGQCSAKGGDADLSISLDVLCMVRLPDGLGHQIPIKSSKLRLPSHTAAAGVPFTLELPSYLPPSLSIDTHQIEYRLRATHKRMFRSTTVTVPLQIVDGRPAPAKIRPPAVGERQVEPVFAEVAEKTGWRIGPSVDKHPELGTIMPWIYAPHHGVVMRLGYAFRDDGTTFLVSRIRYRPLELGLRVGWGRGGREDLRAGVPDWDKDHEVEAKDTARTRELLTTVVPELGPLGSLVRWDDDWLICERQVTDVTVALVDEVATALRTVARKVASVVRGEGPDVGPYR